MNNKATDKTDNLISTLSDYVETIAKDENAILYAKGIAEVTNALAALITARANA